MTQLVAEHGTLAASNQKIVEVTKAFMSGKSEIAEAESLLAKAKVSHIEKIRAACAGVSPVNEKDWDSHWKPVVEHQLREAGYKKESVGPTASNLKVAVIALTNYIAPNPDETFTAFVKRARQEIKDKGIVETNGAGRPKEDKAITTRKPSERQLALELLARGGDRELPDEQVAKRARTLDYLLTAVGWEKLMLFAAEQSKANGKPLQLAA